MFFVAMRVALEYQEGLKVDDNKEEEDYKPVVAA